MGLFSKVAAALGSKSSAVVKQGAKQVRQGKSGFATNAFAKAGNSAKKAASKKR